MRKGVASVILLWQFGAVPSVAAQLTQPERERLVAHLEMTASWLRDEVSGLSPAQLTFRRAPGSWTILETIDHLVVVGPVYWQDLQNAAEVCPAGRDAWRATRTFSGTASTGPIARSRSRQRSRKD